MHKIYGVAIVLAGFGAIFGWLVPASDAVSALGGAAIFAGSYIIFRKR